MAFIVLGVGDTKMPKTWVRLQRNLTSIVKWPAQRQGHVNMAPATNVKHNVLNWTGRVLSLSEPQTPHCKL